VDDVQALASTILLTKRQSSLTTRLAPSAEVVAKISEPIHKEIAFPHLHDIFERSTPFLNPPNETWIFMG